MLKFDVKRKINTLRDILVGKVPDPKAQVEQITIAMIYKFMDDMDIEAIEFGGERVFFKEEYEKYAWSELMSSENSGQQRAYIYSEGIEKMSMNPYIPQLFRDIFRGAYIPYRDPETLNMFLKEISEFSYDNSEDLGNAFEYLLSIMGSQGDAGQFRTPRHIIDMMVEIIDPKKNDTILDPACGTAGFLISAYKHILAANVDENGKSTLTSDDRKRLTENFAGYDISPDMVRLSRVNMYLHRFTKPQISEYDTLSSEEKWDDNYDVILANPPFMTPKGGIIPHNRYRVKARRAEVLFVDYIAEHLNPTGKAAIIVPEGIVFQSANAYKELRKYLVEDGLLYAVVSLPAGVFNPYSGVKTSILFLDKTLAKQKDEILFLRMNNDGFDLGAQRKEISLNDIPAIINAIKLFQCGQDITDNPLATLASKKQLSENDYILSGDRYLESSGGKTRWEMIELGELVDILDNERRPITKSDRQAGQYPYYGATGVLDYVDGYLFDEPLVLVGEDGAKWGANEETAYPINGKTWVNNHAHVLRPNRNRILDTYLICLLNTMDISRYVTGGIIPKLNQKSLRNIRIPVPPISIQEEIVKEIDSYQLIINGAKQVVENYKPFIKFDSNWKVYTLGDICTLTYGYTDTAKEQGDARFVRITDINNAGFLKENDKKYISLTGDSSKYLLKPDDVLVARTGATYGKTMIFLEDYPAVYASFLIKLDFDKNFISPWYYWVFSQTQHYWNQANKLVTGGGQPQFNANAIKQIKIPLPSLEEQEIIVSKVKDEISIVQNNIKLINICKQRIIEKLSIVWED